LKQPDLRKILNFEIFNIGNEISAHHLILGSKFFEIVEMISGAVLGFVDYFQLNSIPIPEKKQ